MTDTTHLVPPRLQDARPATKLVYLSLREHGPADADTVAAETGLHPQTVRRQARELLDRGEVRKRPVLSDARRREFAIVADPDPHPDS